MLRALAVQGPGVERLADHHIASELETGQLVVVLENFELDREPIYAVFPSKRHLRG